MKEVLDKMISEAENPEEGVAVQLMVGGAMLSGAVRHSKELPKGFYELMAPMQRQDRTIAMVRMIIKGSDVQMIGTPVKKEEPQIQPVGGLVIPGRR